MGFLDDWLVRFTGDHLRWVHLKTGRDVDQVSDRLCAIENLTVAGTQLFAMGRPCKEEGEELVNNLRFDPPANSGVDE